MNYEEQLKIQAYLDGELSSRESRHVADWLARDAEARALMTALSQTKSLLSANELPVKVPGSREFYWSQVERQIQSEDAAEYVHPHRPFTFWLWRLLAPAGVAVMLALWVGMPMRSHTVTKIASREVIETPLPGTSTITFQCEGLSVVWVDTSGI